MSIWLLYLIICVATYSATRLLIADHFPPIRVTREWLVKHLDPRDDGGERIKFNGWVARACMAVSRSIAYLITCFWCESVWVGAVIIWATSQYTSVPLPWLLLLVARAVTGWLANFETWGEQRWKLNRSRWWLANDDLNKRGYQVED